MGVLLGKLTGSCSVLSEASHWCVVQGLLGRTLMQANVICCLWLTLGTWVEVSVIHSLWLPLLALGAHRKDQAVHQG